jgi:hypothetical protein
MRLRDSERGAILVFVGLSVFMLTAFLTFVLDYGVFWMSRRQAQNSADAGALSGAVARLFDETTDPPSPTGIAYNSALSAANANGVMGATPGVVVTFDCPTWVPTGSRCVRVDTHRDGTNGSTVLPAYFANLFGLTSQQVRATATARLVTGNATDCLKPIAVADKWLEGNDPEWAQTSEYDEADGDDYIPPYDAENTTGFVREDENGDPVDAGYQIALKTHPADENRHAAGWAMALDLPPGPGGQGQGANAWEANLAGCTSADNIGIALEAETCEEVNLELGCLPVQTGNMHNAAIDGAEAIIATDSTAYWDTTANDIAGAVNINPNTGLSRRVVPIALFDTELLVESGCSGSTCIVKLVHLLGFFIEGICGDGTFVEEDYIDCSGNASIVGRLRSFPALYRAGAGEINGSFIDARPILIR